MQTLFLILLACTSSKSTEDPIFLDLPPLPTASEELEAAVRSEVHKPRWLSISLMGEVRGELEPCGCPTLPYGGFKRRETMLNEYSELFSHFHFDAGELLLKGFSTESQLNASDRALTLAKLSKKMNVTVWTPGPSDLQAVGLDLLQELDGPQRISATWIDHSGNWIFNPTAVVESGGIKVGVIGLSAPILDPLQNKDLSFLDPKEAIPKALKTLPEHLDLIIGLGSINDDKITSLRAQHPEISAYLTTRGGSYDEPRSNGKVATIIEAPERGRYVQQIYIRLGSTPSTPLFNPIETQDWRELIVKRQKDAASGHSFKEPDLFKQEGSGLNIFYNELIALNKSFDYGAHTETDDLLSDFRTFQLEQAQVQAKKPLEPLKKGYASVGACVRCHTKEMAKWSLTKHARAWEALVQKKETDNPECIGCHSTGFSQPGGFGELSQLNIRRFQAVQCESCHGPMQGHPDEESVQSTPISKDTCTGCHDEANSPSFDWSTYLHKSTCQ